MMSVVKSSTKKRKVCVEFRDLIDFEVPLWRDVASIIFLFLDDGDLNRFFRASKVLFGLVKERAVFRNPHTFQNTVESNSIFRNFYFKEVHLLCEPKILPASDVDQLLRQRFLVVFFSNGHDFDYRVFLRQNERGRPFFPVLRRISYSTDNFDSCYFWEFLEQFPRRINFEMRAATWGNEQFRKESLRLSGEGFKKLVNLGKFIKVSLVLPLKIDSQTSDFTTYFESLSRLEAEDLHVLIKYGDQYLQRFSTFMECLAKNSKLQKLRLIFARQESQVIERVFEIVSDPENLCNITRFVFYLHRNSIECALRGTKPLLKKLKSVFFILMGVKVDDEILEGFRKLREEFKAKKENQEWGMWIKAYAKVKGYDNTSISFNRRTSRVKGNHHPS